jgi:hypothetical protein
MKIDMKLRVLVTGGITFLSTAAIVLADSNNGASQPITLTDPLGGSESFTSVATNVSQFLVADVAIPLTVIMVLVGAFQIMTSAGDPEKFSKGRKTILYAAIGFLAAIISLGAVSLIKNFLGQS